jgi:hypothetical protein
VTPALATRKGGRGGGTGRRTRTGPAPPPSFRPSLPPALPASVGRLLLLLLLLVVRGPVEAVGPALGSSAEVSTVHFVEGQLEGGGKEGGRGGEGGSLFGFCVEGGGYGCHSDGLDELDTMVRRKEGIGWRREGGREGRNVRTSSHPSRRGRRVSHSISRTSL